MTITEFIEKLEELKGYPRRYPGGDRVDSGRLLRARPRGAVGRVGGAGQAQIPVCNDSLRRGALMRHGALLVCLHAVVWAFVLWATSDGDCTKSGDCPQGQYCKAGTCVPKEAR